MNMQTYGKLRVELMKAKMFAGARAAHPGLELFGPSVRSVETLEAEVSAMESKLGIPQLRRRRANAAAAIMRTPTATPTAKRKTLREIIADAGLDKLRRVVTATDNERATATHEAAHIAVAFVLGATVSYARAGNAGEGQAAGLTVIHTEGLSVNARATIAVAGAVGERLLAARPDAVPSPADERAWTHGAHGYDRNAVLQHAYDEAKRIVDKHSGSIRQLRDELLGSACLTAKQLDPWKSRFESLRSR